MSVPQHIHFDQSHKFISCALHRYAVLPSKVLSHFNEEHRDETTYRERCQIQDSVDKLCEQHEVYQQYSDFKIPEHPQAPFTGLRIIKDALCCTHCGVIATGANASHNLYAHLRAQHNIKKPVKERELKQWYEDHIRAIHCQQFFTSVPSSFRHLRISRKFEVLRVPTPSTDNDPSPSSAETNAPPPGSAQALKSQLMQATKWAEATREKLLEEIPSAPSLSTNPWIAHTGFLQVFAETPTWDAAIAYVSNPTAALEPKLHYLYCTVKSMLRTWQNVTAQTSRYARIRVMQEHQTDVPLHPLETYQTLSLRHAGPLQKIFIFFYRVLEDDKKMPPTLTLQPHQEHAWAQLASHLASTHIVPTVDDNHTRTHLTTFEDYCYKFWLSLIEQTSRSAQFELALLTPIAFLSLSPTGEGFREVYNFATDLAALKKFCRFAALQKLQDHFLDTPQAQQQDHPNQGDLPLSADEANMLINEQDQYTPSTDTEANNRELADRFRTWVYNYLTTEYPTSMNWLITTARFISKFRYGDNLDAFVHWDGDNVTVRGLKTNFAAFATMVGNEYEEASKVLCQIAYVSSRSELPAIPWDTLVEEPRNATPGYSVFNPSNPALQHGQNFVVQQLMSEVNQKTFAASLIKDLQDFTQVTRYCNLVNQFLNLLLSLTHFTSGQPARGTELLSIQLENSQVTGIRNIFLYKGLVAVVPRYHKGYNRDKSVKTIYRFLPREIGSLLVWYIWLIRPFYLLVQGQIDEGLRTIHYEKAQSHLLWSNKDGKQCTDSQLLSRAIQKATLRWMGKEILIGVMRHLIIAFGRKLTSTGTPHELSKDEVDDIMEEVEAEAREMQAGHSPETARAVYALDVSRIFSQRYDNAEAHFKTSSQWHKALNFVAVEDLSFPAAMPPTAKSLIQKAERTGINLLHLLRENFGESANFRGQQEPALNAIMTGESVVAYIARTGAGKSILFMLPACFPGYGQSIVIVPLAALRTDLLQRCAALHIRSTIWKQGACDEQASIVLATPESLSNEAFQSYIARQQALGKLERIVVDEFHYVILPNMEYRPHLRNLHLLTKYHVPLTLLTATMPPTDQHQAFRLLGLPTNTTPFREPTNRPNIRYEVYTLKAPKQSILSHLAAHVSQAIEEFQKVLVYVDLTVTAETIARKLDCLKCHGKMADDQKSDNLLAFTSATKGALVATSALTEGYHVADIRAVIRFGLPANFISFNQENGRAGRDGEPCLAQLVVSNGLINTHFNKADDAAKRIVTDYVQAGSTRKTCRRILIDAYLDGNTSRKMCKPSEQPCDACQENFYVPSSSRYVQTSTTQGPHSSPTKIRPTSATREVPATPQRGGSAANNSAVESTPMQARSSSPAYELSAAPNRFTSSFTSPAPGPPSTPSRLVLSPKESTHVGRSPATTGSISKHAPKRSFGQSKRIQQSCNPTSLTPSQS